MCKICCFCGHRSIITENLENILEYTLTDLIENQGYDTFYSGGMGEFDKLCERVIRKLKRKFPYIHLCLIIYKYKNNFDKDYYDECILPDLEGVHYKRAITERNKWMIKKSDLILCYIYKDHSGAYDTMKYAEKNKKNIINLYKHP